MSCKHITDTINELQSLNKRKKITRIIAIIQLPDGKSYMMLSHDEDIPWAKYHMEEFLRGDVTRYEGETLEEVIKKKGMN